MLNTKLDIRLYIYMLCNNIIEYHFNAYSNNY